MSGRSSFYEPAQSEDRVGRGDIALVYLPQSRAVRETEPPLSRPHPRVSLPAYPGSLTLSDARAMPDVEVRVWPALAVVVMDSCELDRHFNLGRSRQFWDSRVAVAPLVFETQFPNGPWRRMEQGDVPLYGFYLETLSPDVDGITTWPRAVVDLRGTTLVSRRLVELNRRFRLTDTVAESLGVRVLEYWYLREVARRSQLEARRGKRLRDVVPVHLAPDYTVLRITFDGADPLLVACIADPAEA
ncbi:MAG: hypothetical protein HY331_15285 [Chloroflexi bacterium]|nr:hypothetical protein [Chloroflexota bacterium]